MNKGKVVNEFPELITNIKTQAAFILIVEKETIFYKLLSESIQDELGYLLHFSLLINFIKGECILITVFIYT